MFILEIRRSHGKGSINNGGHYQSEIVSVEAAVKDERRFPQKWAYFGFGRGERRTAAPATSSCNSCHSQNAAVENTFVQFYPTLLEIADRKEDSESGIRGQERRPIVVGFTSDRDERFSTTVGQSLQG